MRYPTLSANKAPSPALPRYGTLVRDRRRIGILGGSFNPAHAGHVAISLEAMKRFRLHAVWWLVNPCNPLKNNSEILPLSRRLEAAKTITSPYRRIKVWVLEPALGTPYTVPLLERLAARQACTHRFWLMGADSLETAHRWHRWPDLFRKNTVVVFARQPYTVRSTFAKAAVRFRASRCSWRRLPSKQQSWSLVQDMTLHPLSASEIRRQMSR